MIVAAVGLPVLLAWLLVAEDMRTDLTGLKPAGLKPADLKPGDLQSGDLQSAQIAGNADTRVIGWPDLDPLDDHPAQIRWPPQTLVKMAGYMMDGSSPDGYTTPRDGEVVRGFVLMPDAGHFLHPAQHIPEEMVEVRLNRPVWFKHRRLVWVSGLLTRVTHRADTRRALFVMQDALVSPAADPEIGRWFVP
jgi:hypothetical protein